MTTPESNEVPWAPHGQQSAEGTHAIPPQNPTPPPAQPPYAQPQPAPPQSAQAYPGAQPAPGQQAPSPYPAPGQPGPYPYPAGQPGAQYGYPVAQPVRTPTGTLSWALGFLVFLPIPFLGGIISGVVMALTFGAAAKHGGVARENARSAANWGLTYVTLSLVLVIGHFIAVIAFSDTGLGRGFFPIGIPIMVYLAVSILHVVLVIMGTVKTSSGGTMRVPFAIPYIRA